LKIKVQNNEEGVAEQPSLPVPQSEAQTASTVDTPEIQALDEEIPPTPPEEDSSIWKGYQILLLTIA